MPPTPTASSRALAQVLNFGVPTPVTTSTVLVAAGINAIAGWSLCETTGVAVAKLVIWDNPSAAAGLNYGTVTLASNESTREWFVDLALQCVSGGLYLQIVAGSVSGAVFYQ